MSEFKPGDIVEWTSQAAGSGKTKRGKVLAIVKKGETKEFDFLKGCPGSRVKFTTIGFSIALSRFNRAVVEVPRGGKSRLCDYYAPRIEWLRKVEDGDEA